MSVSRGLLTTEARSLRQLAPSEPEDAAARAFSSLIDSPAGHYAWKERAQWASRLCKGQADFHGRRLFSDAARLDAKYVARISRRALHGSLPGSKLQWGYLRNSLVRIYSELRESST